MYSADIVIIGGGIIGCATLHHLAAYYSKDRQKKILLLDKNQIAGGITGQSGGFVRIFHPDIYLAKLAIKGFEYYKNFDFYTNNSCNFNNTGFLWIEREASKYKKLVHEINLYTNNRYPIMLQGIDTISTQWGIDYLSTTQEVVFEPMAGCINPVLACNYWIKSASTINDQVQVHQNIEVLRLVHTNGKINQIETNHGIINTKIVIIATGVGTQEIMQNSKLDPLPITTKSFQYNIYNNKSSITMPVIIDVINDLYIIPQNTKNMIVGFLSKDQEIISFNTQYNEALSEQITQKAKKAFPNINFDDLVSQNISFDSYTTNEYPIVKQWKNISGLYLATGCCSGGIKMAPSIARSIMDMIINTT